jgi:hypothetical protein
MIALSLKTKSALKKPAAQRPLVIEVAGTGGAKTVTLDDHPPFSLSSMAQIAMDL